MHHPYADLRHVWWPAAIALAVITLAGIAGATLPT